MSIKDWLKRGRYLNKEIDALVEAKAGLYARLTSTTAPLTDVCVSSGGKSTGDSGLINYLHFEQEINEQIDRLIVIKLEIEQAISKVPDSFLRVLLTEYYVNFKTWEQIAANMHFTYRHILRMHKKALELLEDVASCPIN